MVYPGKQDWWISGLLALVAAAFFVGGGIFMSVAVGGGRWPPLFPASVMLLAGGLFVWVLRGTNCEITEAALIIRAGPFRRTILLDAIEEVVPRQTWYGGPALEMNFGLSAQGVRCATASRAAGCRGPSASRRRIGPRSFWS